MNADASGMSRNRCLRRSERALFGGVCAAAADHFGANLTAVRILTVISFVAMPVTILIYVALYFMLPGRTRKRRRCRRRRAKNARDSQYTERARREAADRHAKRRDAKRRFESLDERLVQLEKIITSPRYQLDKEFRNL